MKRLLPLLIFIALAIALYFGLRRDPHKIPSPFINKPIPAFTAPSLKDAKVTLSDKDLTGHVALLNVFATWCLTCQAEHPILMDIARSGIVKVYGIDYKDKRAKALKWLKHDGDPYQKVFFDPTGKIGINLGVYGTPETFLIDKHGRIRYKWIGAISPRVWQDKLKPRILKLEQGA